MTETAEPAAPVAEAPPAEAPAAPVAETHVAPAPTSTAIATRVVSPLSPSATRSKIDYAKALADSGMLPRAFQGKPANVLWAVEYGADLGLSPVATMSGVHVIEGKPSANADLMKALVRKAGHRIRITGNNESATCTITRHDDPEFDYIVTWELRANDRGNPSAEEAGLLGKGTWQSYPAAMLKSRAISQCVRDACSEVLFGMVYTPEELGANVDEDGHVVGGVVVEDLTPVIRDAIAEAVADGVEDKYAALQEVWRRFGADLLNDTTVHYAPTGENLSAADLIKRLGSECAPPPADKPAEGEGAEPTGECRADEGADEGADEPTVNPDGTIDAEIVEETPAADAALDEATDAAAAITAEVVEETATPQTDAAGAGDGGDTGETPPAPAAEAEPEPPAKPAKKQTTAERTRGLGLEETKFQAAALGVDPRAHLAPFLPAPDTDVRTLNGPKLGKFLIEQRARVIEALRASGRATEADQYERIGKTFPVRLADVFERAETADAPATAS